MATRTTLVIVLLGLSLAACSSDPEPSADVAPPAGPAPGLENGSYTARLNGFDIHYEVHGRGPVMMALTNSWGLSHEALREMFRPLEERVTMVYFDPRGMGRSGPIATDTDMSREAVRADLDALRQHLGLDRIHAIGWSDGAINLLFLALERPEILESAVFVHGTARYGDEEAAEFGRRYPEMLARYETFMTEMADESLTDEDRTARQREMWLGEFFPAITADPESMRSTIARTFAGSELSWPHARYSQESLPTFDLLDRLPEIRVRSLVVAGVHDSIPVAAAERMAKGIPEAKMVLLENSGHFAPLEEPERFRDAVFGFLGVL